MPFDGIVTKCIAEELNYRLNSGRIEKVHQPERDEIHIIIRSQGENHRLLISANPSNPRIYLTQRTKENPAAAPLFCMLLRKHLAGGKILSITAENCERIIQIQIESANEMGDISTKTLIVEIMGKHSNIILLNEDFKIIDALIHVDKDMSSVREVMPARVYTAPPPQIKMIPGLHTAEEIINRITAASQEVTILHLGKALLDTIMGFSPLLCREVCFRSALEEKVSLSRINQQEWSGLEETLSTVFGQIRNAEYAPSLLYQDLPDPVSGSANQTNLLDYHCFPITSTGYPVSYPSMSEALDDYYDFKGRNASLQQRKSSLLKQISNNMNRCKKKYAIQQESIRESANAEKYKLFGELLTANIYTVLSGAKSVSLFNYYSDTQDEYVDISLDPDLSPQANAQRYFKKYRKAASTQKNAIAQAVETEKELIYLESVLHELEMSGSAQEIDEIKIELTHQKYLSVTQNKKKKPMRVQLSAPHIFISTDGLNIYVGKNNRQNDQLTMKTASSNDIWLHVKDMPGSHVIIEKKQNDIPMNTILEAASLAAYFSKAKMSENVRVDYTTVRNVKKPSGSKPGMVIYEHYKSLFVTPNEQLMIQLKKGDPKK